MDAAPPPFMEPGPVFRRPRSATPPFVSPDIPPGPEVDPITRTVIGIARVIQAVFQRGPLVQPRVSTEGAGGVLPRTFPRLAVGDYAPAIS